MDLARKDLVDIVSQDRSEIMEKVTKRSDRQARSCIDKFASNIASTFYKILDPDKNEIAIAMTEIITMVLPRFRRQVRKK